MKQKILRAGIAALSLATSLVGVAKADTGYTATFSTAVAYMNVGTGTAHMTLSYYPENTVTPINITLADLPAGGSSTIFASSVGTLPDGFKGSGVISSDQPIVATLVQISSGSGTTVKNRPLSNGFASGATGVLVATVLKERNNTNTRFAVQNAEASGNIDVTVRFYSASPFALVSTQTATGIPAGAAKYFDVGTIASIPSNFSGSARVDAVKSGTSTAAVVAVTALELGTANANASSFEGTSGGANTIYMPSALCNAPGESNTAYAIQNASDSASASVTVSYRSLAGAEVARKDATIAAGGKLSSVACSDGFPNGTSGSAVITSSGAPIVAMLKVYNQTPPNGAVYGLYTAALGATSGSNKLYAPFVRWTDTQWTATTRQRSYIAIQNIGGALNAGQVTVKFLDKNGAQVGSTVSNAAALGAGQKFSVNPSQAGSAATEFGYYSDGTSGGGMLIEGPSGSQLVAVVRVATYNADNGAMFGEDYLATAP
ncbi:MAG TPA: FxLYD domain-containing protein [Thermoflexales bacterium]|nr:FxLYD domain-containing protein [Thermoflexales bacterium]